MTIEIKLHQVKKWIKWKKIISIYYEEECLYIKDNMDRVIFYNYKDIQELVVYD